MEKLKEYLKENATNEQLQEMAKSVNSYNGNLDYLEYWENDEEFFNTFFQDKPMEVARATFYGDYNYMDDYVRFNAYGNLTSVNEWKYEQEIEDYKEEIISEWLNIYDDDYRYVSYDDVMDLIRDFDEEQGADENE